jgi:hypothetical protein
MASDQTICIEENCDRPPARGDERCELHAARLGARPKALPVVDADPVDSLDSAVPQQLQTVPAISLSRSRFGFSLGCIALFWICVIVTFSIRNDLVNLACAAAAIAMQIAASTFGGLAITGATTSRDRVRGIIALCVSLVPPVALIIVMILTVFTEHVRQGF